MENEEPHFVDVPSHAGAFTAGRHAPLTDDTSTMWSLFCATCQRFAPNECLGARRCAPSSSAAGGRYEWLTYSQLFDCASAFGSALKRAVDNIPSPSDPPAPASAPAGQQGGAATLQPQGSCAGPNSAGAQQRRLSIARPGEFGVILADNCAEWVIAEYGMHRQSVVPVPLFSRNSLSMTVNALRTVQPVIAVVDRVLLLHLAMAVNESRVLSLRTAVVIGGVGPEESRITERYNIRCIGFEEFLNCGREMWTEPMPPAPGDIYTIIFTGGTVPDAQAAVLTHRHMTSMTDTLLSWPNWSQPMLSETWISYLPLSHLPERCFVAALLRGGARIGFGTGSAELLFEDLEDLKPTLLPGCPRIWKRMFERVTQRVEHSGRVRSWMFRHALTAKTVSFTTGRKRPWINWDKIVFAKMRQRIGGHVRMFLNVSTPLPPELGLWLSQVFLVRVFQFYGLTTAGGAVTAATDETQIDSCGYPFPGVSVRLVDVPEMGHSTDAIVPSGEVWVRPAVPFVGYLGDELRSQAVVRPGGYVATGDVGRLNPDGTLTIIDRLHSAIKTSAGDYVQVETLEALYSQVPVVSQLWVYADGTEPYTVAVVVPDPIELLQIGRSLPNRPTGPGSLPHLCSDRRVREQVKSRIEEFARKHHRYDFEIPRAVYLEPEPFTVANGSLSALTAKLRRDHLCRHYRKVIEQLQDEVAASQAAGVGADVPAYASGDGGGGIKMPVCFEASGMPGSRGRAASRTGRHERHSMAAASHSSVSKLSEAAEVVSVPPCMYSLSPKGPSSMPSATSLPSSLSSSNGLSACGSPPHDGSRFGQSKLSLQQPPFLVGPLSATSPVPPPPAPPPLLTITLSSTSPMPTLLPTPQLGRISLSPPPLTLTPSLPRALPH